MYAFKLALKHKELGCLIYEPYQFILNYELSIYHR